MRYIYLHGFASSPQSTKARFFAGRFSEGGLDLNIPNLAPDFANLESSSQIEIVRQAAADADEITLLGSSMGGYVAALCGSLDLRVRRMVLLAPAFGLSKRWAATLGGERVDEWRRTGTLEVYHYGDQATRNLGYQFATDAEQYPDYPEISQPSLICHGRHDEVVPASHSVEFASRYPLTRLVLMDSGHELTDVLDDLWRETAAFLGLEAK